MLFRSDITPGGSYATIDEIAGQGEGYSAFRFAGFRLSLGTSTTFNRRKSAHCFIPTKSALAFTGSNKDLGENLSNRSLICTGETPFQAYYAPTTNEEHVFLTAASVAWTLNEIKGQPQLNALSGFSMTGPDLVCNTATYAISPALPAGAAVTWTTSNANVSITSGGVATRLNNYVGPVTVSAALNSSCGTGMFTKAVTARAAASQITGTYGYISSSTFPLAPNNNVRATGITVSINPAGLDGITWQLASPTPTSWSSNGNMLWFTLPPYGGAAFRVTANSCGTPLTATYNFYNTSGSATFRLYPNPTADEVDRKSVV